MQTVLAQALAPAKLNVYLGVYPEKDERSYHRVDSVMVAISLCDELIFEKADQLEIVCTPQVDFPQEQNSVWKACKAMEQAFEKSADYRISITKNIPFKSGLGGASSDAVAAMLCLCKLWDIDTKDPHLETIAQSLGADMPFFLYAHPMLLQGAGDIPEKVFDGIGDVFVTLVRPYGDGITAVQAYQEFDVEPTEAQPLQPLMQALQDKDVDALARTMSNNLDPVACRIMPELTDVKAWLDAQAGVLSSMVTGSGSCVFAVCSSQMQSEMVALKAQHQGWWARPAYVIDGRPKTDGSFLS